MRESSTVASGMLKEGGRPSELLEEDDYQGSPYWTSVVISRRLFPVGGNDRGGGCVVRIIEMIGHSANHWMVISCFRSMVPHDAQASIVRLQQDLGLRYLSGCVELYYLSPHVCRDGYITYHRLCLKLCYPQM